MSARIVVLGSLNMDLVVMVSKLPVAGETVLGPRLGTYPGGKGANQAVAAARLGADVTMVGRVGNDPFGDTLIQNLEANDVGATGVARDPKEPTGAALIIVEQGGQNMIAVAAGANQAVGRAEVGRLVGALRKGDLLVMQLEVPLDAVEQAVAVAGTAGARVLLNGAPAQRLRPSLLEQIDIFVVNQREATLLSEQPEPATAARALLAVGPKLVAVTVGVGGCIVADAGGTRPVSSFPVEAVDATGAGDAFVAGLAVGLARHLPPEDAVRLGNAAGAAAVMSVGAQASLPRPVDLQRLFGIDLSSAKIN